ncbi:MAG: M20/M25/M40 family metallo-hydrolase, partial [Bryobacteraceae bacterium]|nr:M20/M25/M40 family metallo-hydrolase [Bryobacteraceae bacterium]
MRFVSLLLLVTTASPLLEAQQASLTTKYAATAKKLIDAALADEDGYNKLAYLCDQIGTRLSGSAGLERAVKWSAETMKKDGLSNVTTQPVKVPHWVRGAESARIIEPQTRDLNMIGLGNSVGTPANGVTANLVVVSNFDELTALGRAKVQGKIVLFDAPYKGYGPTVMYRAVGPSRAAALGAVAVLVRSVTSLAMQQPHTGALSYDPSQPKIPAAAVTVEDSMLLARLAAAGPVQVQLKMEAKMEPDADSANVFAEITGSEKPDEIVVLGGHLDSWDVGQGAQDDGSGVIASLQAVALIKKLGLTPRRTIRVVFWTNEENGGRGGQAYRQLVGSDIGKHVAAIEMDGGAEKPLGFGYGGAPRAGGRRGASPSEPPALPAAQLPSMKLMQEIGTLLEPIGAGTMTPGGGGADIGPLIRDGVPGLSTRTVGTHYFDWHHTRTDTLDKVDKED